MQIGVISDTHVPTRSRFLPQEVLRLFDGVDLILHAGDLVSLQVLEPLERIARVVAVSGNMDEPEVVERLPRRVIVPAGRFRIGMIHGSGMPHDLSARARVEFHVNEVDAIVFGHSHIPVTGVLDSVYMMNPGSPTTRGRAGYTSVGIMDVGDEIGGRILRVP